MGADRGIGGSGEPLALARCQAIPRLLASNPAVVAQSAWLVGILTDILIVHSPVLLGTPPSQVADSEAREWPPAKLT